MLPADLLNPMKQIETIVNIVNSLGVHLQIGTDFHVFVEDLLKQSLKPHVNPAFDPRCSNISSTTGLWIIGHNAAGDIVHTQAIKMLNLADISLDKYLHDHLSDFRSYGYNFDIHKSKWFLSEAASQITGQVCYHGELWLKGGASGYRGGCLATLLTRMMLIVAMQYWSPDYFIGLQSPMTSCRGLATREGYMHIEQRSILWHQFDSPEFMEDWLVWMSCNEAKFNLRVPPEIFFQLFENSAVRSKAATKKVREFA